MTTPTCRKCAAPLPPDAIFCHLCGVRQQGAGKPSRKGRTRPNGAGTAYKRGRTWTARVVRGWKTVEDDGRKKRIPVYATRGGFKTKREALDYCLVLREKHHVDIDTLPLSHYWELYSENAVLKLSDSTQQAYKIAYSKLSDLHSLPMSQVTVKAMQDLVNQVAPTFDTAKDARSLLSNLFQLAVYDGAVSVNSAQAIELPSSNYREGVPFTDEEVMNLWKYYAQGDAFTAYILLMIYTGMMPVELRRCTVDHIDWTNKIITGVGAKTRKRKEAPIVLADTIMPVLADICDRSQTGKLLEMTEGSFYRSFYATLKSTGCREGLTPYSCRHTTATSLELHTGASPAVIAEVLRQKTITMQRHYIHPETQNALDAVNQIPGQKD